ncbi:MAG: ankyrin repeat domain-containing protein [Pseudomonadota bacterium]
MFSSTNVRQLSGIFVATVSLLVCASAFADTDTARAAIKRKDFAEAATLLQQHAATDPEASYLLAGLHARGQGVARDRDKAMALYEAAAAAGHAGAETALANEWEPLALALMDALEAGEALRIAAARGLTDDIRALLGAGAPIDSSGTNGRTALMEAAEFDHLSAVDALLVANANVNATDRTGETALMKAIRAQTTDVVARLLSAGALVDHQDTHGNTALHLAARYEALPILDLLIDADADFTITNGRGMSALALASRRDDRRLAASLRRAGATLPARFAAVSLHELRDLSRPVNGRSLWFIAAERGELATLRRKLRDGTAINAANGEGRTALMMAARRGYLDVIDFLLDNAGSQTVTDQDGLTAMAHAAVAGQAEALALLLERNGGQSVGLAERLLFHTASSADPATVEVALSLPGATEPTANGATSALMFAAANGHDVVAARLIAAGVPVSALDRQRRSALWFAADGGHSGITETLLAAGADVASVDRSGSSALHRASERGHVDVVRRLLDRGADANLENSRGYTPLMTALEARRYGVIEVLARGNVDLNRRNSFGQTALILAAFRNDGNAIDTLLAFGADKRAVNAARRNAADIAERLGNEAALRALTGS